MAEVIWAQAAVEDVERIVAYIELQNAAAAAGLRRRIYDHTLQLEQNPLSGPVIPEMRRFSRRYRQLVEPPCRIFYRVTVDRAFILNVIRGEMQISPRLLRKRFGELQKPSVSEDPR